MLRTRATFSWSILYKVEGNIKYHLSPSSQQIILHSEMMVMAHAQEENSQAWLSSIFCRHGNMKKGLLRNALDC